MNVRELIEELSKANPDLPVVGVRTDDYYLELSHVFGDESPDTDYAGNTYLLMTFEGKNYNEW